MNNIESILKQLGITNYTVNIDLTVTVNGDCDLFNKNLNELPCNFKEIHGNFYCDYNQLTSLQGCPQTINGNFYCFNNQLTSLHGCPQIVRGGFYCYNNNLTSLHGCPKIIRGDFFCTNNQLSSLEDCPQIIHGNFDCEEHLKCTKEYKLYLINRKLS